MELFKYGNILCQQTDGDGSVKSWISLTECIELNSIKQDQTRSNKNWIGSENATAAWTDVSLDNIN